jgi:hypothetical protein
LVTLRACTKGRRIEKFPGLLVSEQERFDFVAQCGVVTAGLVQIRSPFYPCHAIQRFEEDRFDLLCPIVGL